MIKARSVSSDEGFSERDGCYTADLSGCILDVLSLSPGRGSSFSTCLFSVDGSFQRKSPKMKSQTMGLSPKYDASGTSPHHQRPKLKISSRVVSQSSINTQHPLPFSPSPKSLHSPKKHNSWSIMTPHSASQRYLSTRGGSYDVCLPNHKITFPSIGAHIS